MHMLSECNLNYIHVLPGEYMITFNSACLSCRMIPSTSYDFLVRDLVSGREYDLCVLAVYDDGVTSLTTTRQVGCVTFVTETEYSQCQSLRSHFLGGTMIIIIGGIIVASVLVFIIILMIRYKVYSHQGTDSGKGTQMTNLCSQRNGGQAAGQVPHSSSKIVEGQEAIGAGLGGAAASLKDSTAMVLVTDSETTVQISEMISEDIVYPTQKNQPRTYIELKRQHSLSSKEGTSTDTSRDTASPQVSDEKRVQRDWSDFKI
ncbi:leucine-rich repeat and fibronectin type III domain-containing protein 1-like protein [Carassius auratus]|uniref:Leucine-rich repeat and fibronectin type III domain-containing protein 1-like protein n=1 Tax=Carassius auratus TaxID=7957 RepID=A0A6P6LDJ2_CARAU|nr:leucine-rich repeat and fibronectin type III domain-containing protein 1-like protein [Carassius auratus]